MGERYVRPPLTASEPDAHRAAVSRVRGRRLGPAVRGLAALVVLAAVLAALVAGTLLVVHRLTGDDSPGVGGRPVPGAGAPASQHPAR
jgi:hypothetical protein